jgi:poly(A) polymerase Pap1
MSNKKHFGITPPISLKTPEGNEIQATNDLIDTLATYGQYESGEEAQQRYAM